jgi:hypothetical protein
MQAKATSHAGPEGREILMADPCQLRRLDLAQTGLARRREFYDITGPRRRPQRSNRLVKGSVASLIYQWHHREMKFLYILLASACCFAQQDASASRR